MNRIILLVASAVLLLSSAPAYAASPSADLVKLAPMSAKVLIGVNVPAVRESFLFQDAMNFIRSQPANGDVLGFVLQGGFVDIEKDVEAILIATPAAQLPANPQAPVPEQDVALALSATFDKDEVLEAARKNYGELKMEKVGELEVWDTGKFKFVLVDKKTMVLVSASAPYEAATLAAVADPSKSSAKDKAMQSVMGRIQSSRGIWMSTTETPQAPGMPVPPMKDMALALDIAGGMKMELRGDAISAVQAKLMSEQLEKLKAENKDSAMVQALGAKPLLENLKVKQAKSRVDITTRMTSKEFTTLFERLKAMRGAPQMGQPAAGPQPGATSAPTDAPKAPKDGVDADFN